MFPVKFATDDTDRVDDTFHHAPLVKRLYPAPLVERNIEPKAHPRILLIDDDPGFGKIIERAASKLGIMGPDNIRVCSTLMDFNALESFDFDVVVMDYDLGDITGLDLARHIEHNTDEEIPIILVSQSRQAKVGRWPHSIQGFIHKGMGPYAVLDAALEARSKRRNHKRIA